MFLHIVLQHREVSVLTDGVEVVPIGPELTSPQEDFHLGVSFEHFFRRDAFDRRDHARNPDVWNRLDEKVCMIFVETDIEESVRVSRR